MRGSSPWFVHLVFARVGLLTLSGDVGDDLLADGALVIEVEVRSGGAARHDPCANAGAAFQRHMDDARFRIGAADQLAAEGNQSAATWPRTRRSTTPRSGRRGAGRHVRRVVTTTWCCGGRRARTLAGKPVQGSAEARAEGRGRRP